MKLIYLNLNQIVKINRCRKNLKKKELKTSKKVYDVVSNLHNQVNSYLTNTYENIILPTFNTSYMVQSAKLLPCTKRMMNTLQFYRFKMKLIEQCNRKNKNLHIISEAYTTMTCGACGRCRQKYIIVIVVHTFLIETYMVLETF